MQYVDCMESVKVLNKYQKQLVSYRALNFSMSKQPVFGSRLIFSISRSDRLTHRSREAPTAGRSLISAINQSSEGASHEHRKQNYAG
jgi:hypothetical protein